MVLLPAGMLFGKALMDKMARQGADQIVHTSRMATTVRNHETWTRRPQRRTENPFSTNELKNRMGGCGVRNLGSKPHHEDFPEFPDGTEKWVGVYRYPGIRGCQLLARAKFIQTLASMTYLPYSGYQYAMGAIDSTWFFSTAALAVAAPLLLAVFSRYLNRLVGVIAMTDDEEWVRIGYLTFWGRRKDKFLRVEDVLPLGLWESCYNPKGKVVKLEWFSSMGDRLYIPTEYCEILDDEKAELLFGDPSIFQTKAKKE